jgi:hypothetical protein
VLGSAGSAGAAITSAVRALLSLVLQLPLLLGWLLLRPADEWRRSLSSIWQGATKEAKRFQASCLLVAPVLHVGGNACNLHRLPR